MKKERTHTIDFKTSVSSEKVYNFAKNVERRADWISIIESAKLLDNPVKVGAKFKEETNRGEMILEFVALEPNSKVRYRTIKAKGPFIDILWDIKESAVGSDVKISFTFIAKGLLTFLLPLIFKKITKEIDQDVKDMQELLLQE